MERIHKPSGVIAASIFLGAVVVFGLEYRQDLLQSLPPVVQKIPKFTPPKYGETIKIPTRDLLGRVIPSGELLIVSYPDCNDCSTQGLNLSLLPSKPRSPIVLAINGEGRFDSSLAEHRDSVFFVAKNSSVLPDAISHYGNTLIVVDEARSVTAFAAPQTSGAFIKEWNK